MIAPAIRILHLDEQLVVADKPPGLLVHRSAESDDKVFLLQALGRQLGRHLYPVHRLDRAASGAIAFALSSAAARRLQACLAAPEARKEYLVLARGLTEERFASERPLSDEKGEPQPARSEFERLAVIDGMSLLRVRLRSGRRHQIRRHLAHLVHHVVGDTTHGKGRDNRALRELYGLPRLVLHAWELEFTHPESAAPLCVRAPLAEDLRQFLLRLPQAPRELIAAL